MLCVDSGCLYTTADVLTFLDYKFGDRVISRRTEHSPDLNPPDFSFFSQAMAHVVRCEPLTPQELKEMAEDFAINSKPEKARAYRQKGAALL